MKASDWYRFIKRPEGRLTWTARTTWAIFVMWVIYGVFCLTVQTIYIVWEQPLSPTTWHSQAIKVLYYIYVGWTVGILIYCIKYIKIVKRPDFDKDPTSNLTADQVDSAPEDQINNPLFESSTTNPAVDCPDKKDSRAADFLQKLLVLFESGKTGQATIQRVGYTGAFIGRHPFLKLHLLINQKEKPPLKLIACTLVNKHLIPRIGDYCNIKYLLGDRPIVVILDIL